MRWLMVAAAGVIGGAAPAADYVAVFTAESVPFEPTKTHTFVSVVRLPGPGGRAGEAHIGWLPASLDIKGITLRPEPGVNLSVAESFAFCRRNGMRVSVWGPYRARPGLFEIIRGQQGKLESGRVRYKPTDTIYPSAVAANCYHAIWQPFTPLRKYAGPFTCGDVTGPRTVKLFRPWLCEPLVTDEPVLGRMVPAGETVVRRSVDDRPTRLDAVRSAVDR